MAVTPPVRDECAVPGLITDNIIIAFGRKHKIYMEMCGLYIAECVGVVLLLQLFDAKLFRFDTTTTQVR